MGISYHKEEPIKLSFTLTRLQRTINPFERLIFLFIIMVVLLIGSLSIIKDPLDTTRWIIIILSLLLLMIFFWWHIWMLFMALINNRYINILIIENNNLIIFGINEPNSAIRRNQLRVVKGFFSTIIIRNLYGFSIVLPNDIIPFESLKELIEGK